MKRIESGTRLIVYVDPSVPSAEAHERVAAARARAGLEPIDIVPADEAQVRADVAEREFSHLSDIGAGEPTSRYLGVWMTLDELEALAPEGDA
jgi:hypothetical protein